MRHTSTIDRRGIAATALLFGLLALPLRADDPKKPQERPDLPLPGVGHGDDDPHVEMARLMGKIERDLREIDRLLSDASAGGEGAGKAAEKTSEAIAGIDQLLQGSERRGHEVIDAIDKLFELANHAHEGGGSCSSSGGLCQVLSKSGSGNREQGQQPGQQEGESSSPIDRQGGTTTQREATPEGPEQKGSKPQGSNPSDEQGKKPGGDQRESPSGDPRGNQDSKLPAENAKASPPGQDATGAPSSTATPVEKWGELPPHVRDVFRAQGGGDMPARYRDWIDAYYRRLAKRPGR